VSRSERESNRTTVEYYRQPGVELGAAATFWFIRPRVTIFNLEGFSNEGVERYFEKVVFLILESLGSTELLFILVMALVFFGPRKLPQLSRSLGKNLADFRRASEDFKRTWNREVSLEESDAAGAVVSRPVLPEQNSILDYDKAGQPSQAPSVQAVAPDRVIARHTIGSDAPHSANETGLALERSDLDAVTDETKPSTKRDWL
jgi:TatA/E family protein of Tat protein translocase